MLCLVWLILAANQEGLEDIEGLITAIHAADSFQKLLSRVQEVEKKFESAFESLSEGDPLLAKLVRAEAAAKGNNFHRRTPEMEQIFLDLFRNFHVKSDQPQCFGEADRTVCCGRLDPSDHGSYCSMAGFPDKFNHKENNLEIETEEKGSTHSSMSIVDSGDPRVSHILSASSRGFVARRVRATFLLGGEEREKALGCGLYRDGRWETHTEFTVEGDTVTCNYSAIGSFAVIFDPDLVASFPLFVTSTAALGLSVLSVLVLIGLFFANLRFSKRSVLQLLILNLSLSILFSDVFFLAIQFVSKTRVICSVFGGLFHYGILAQFCSILTLAFFHYDKFVVALCTKGRQFYIRAIAACWAFPTTIVTLVLAVDYTSYSVRKFCWMEGITLYVSLYSPLGVIMVVCYVLFALMVFSIKKNGKSSKLENKLIVSTSLLLGLGWILGFFVKLGGTSGVMAYLFVIFNATGGFLALVASFIHMPKQYFTRRK